jgi:hypothetical protein
MNTCYFRAKFALSLISISFCSLAYAALPLKLEPANTALPGLENNLKTLQSQLPSTVTLVFPQKLPRPASGQTYYFYSEPANHNVLYAVDIDNSAACHGVHTCNIGQFTATLAGNPEIYYDMNNKELTRPVKLNNGQKAYYTPAHAMADYWPAMITWREGNVLYTLSWQGEVDQAILVNMASSVKPVK